MTATTIDKLKAVQAERENGTAALHVQVSRDQLDAIKRLAGRYGVKVSEIVRMSLDSTIAEAAKSHDQQ